MNIEDHCKKIIMTPRISKRFVILCEGDIPEGGFSPSVRKVKPYWECIHQAEEREQDNYEEAHRKFRDEISMKIAKEVYAHQEGTPHQHLACFFNHLHQLEFG
jgi:hypothetical protein